ncbi:hypothetical protein MMC29_000149 [Sticta canariensis]|nr:hypothetical protein [Sticta canariensis]
MIAGGDQAHSTLEAVSQQSRYNVAGGDQAHGTLEAVSQQSRYNDEDQSKPLPSDPGKQVAVNGGPQRIGDGGDLEVDPKVPLKEDVGQQKVRVHHILGRSLSARRLIIICGITGLIVVIAAVLGGVLGSRHKSSSDKNSVTASGTSPSNSSATSPFVTPTQRNIAAVSFTSNSTNMTRVYFQDNVGQIMEASRSENNTRWSINKTGFGGKNGSVIAAAVSRPSLPLEISIFYLDVNNSINDITYTDATGGWTSGTLLAQGYTAMANSSLSAMYNWCSRCANTTIIAFQDENGYVQTGNLTSSGWTQKQVGENFKPVLGTALALVPFYISGWADRINLYHQMPNLSMAMARWRPKVSNQIGTGWVTNAEILDPIPYGSPIAAASSYFDFSPVDGPAWVEVISLNTTGIEVRTWSGAENAWLTSHQHPSEMANSTNNMKIYGSVAITAIGSAFAVVKEDGEADSILNWQVADDTVDWRSSGKLDLNGIWG